VFGRYRGGYTGVPPPVSDVALSPGFSLPAVTDEICKLRKHILPRYATGVQIDELRPRRVGAVL